eukprot:jgi/Chlat1/6749/Chrsp50S00502
MLWAKAASCSILPSKLVFRREPVWHSARKVVVGFGGSLRYCSRSSSKCWSGRPVSLWQWPSSSTMPAPAKLTVEYAKTGRSGCKDCGEKIGKDEVRLGHSFESGAGYDMVRWYHARCFCSVKHVKALTNNWDHVEGFDKLEAADQTNLQELITAAKEEAAKPKAAAPKRKRKESVDAIASADIAETAVAIASEDTKAAALPTSTLQDTYKGATLPPKWMSYASIIIFSAEGSKPSSKVAAFDFDGCLVNTSVRRTGAEHWKLMYPSVPDKLRSLHEEGYKLVIFSNEANIDRWKNSRQKAVDSKVGRLQNFMNSIDVPMQAFVACGASGDPFRKPETGMWEYFARHGNGDVAPDLKSSFFVGDAAGRPQDHGDSDQDFAKRIGVPFMVPEEVFMGT